MGVNVGQASIALSPRSWVGDRGDRPAEGVPCVVPGWHPHLQALGGWLFLLR